VRLDPQAKYYALLADMQEKNRNWLHHAVDSYMKALELGGPDPRIESALARLKRRMEGGAAESSHGAAERSSRHRPDGAQAGDSAAAGPPPPAAGSSAVAGTSDDPVFDAGDAGDIDPDDTQVGRWLRRRP
jgi:hypothetical protein